ncbi:hypothetical protein [Hydrogenimonas sp.]
MIIRIDTTNLSRGREFSLYAKGGNSDAQLYAFDATTKAYEPLHYEVSHAGSYLEFSSVAPSVDGFLLAQVGGQRVVKKIGYPVPTFVVGYKGGYTFPYVCEDRDGKELYSGNLTPIVAGFYYAPLDMNAAVVTTLGKHFIVNRSMLKMSYDVTMEGGVLGSEFEDAEIGSVSLPDIVLPDVILREASLSSTLPDIEIKEL